MPARPRGARSPTSYRALSRAYGEEATDVAVRSSATAEDLPERELRRPAGELPQRARRRVRRRRRAQGLREPLHAARDQLPRTTWASTTRSVALSVGVQKMVRSDRASAGVIFTLDPETRAPRRRPRDVELRPRRERRAGAGRARPVLVHKATLEAGFAPLVWKKLGTKEVRLVYDEDGHRQVRDRARPRRRARALVALRRRRAHARALGGADRGPLLARRTAPTRRWTSSGRRTA